MKSGYLPIFCGILIAASNCSINVGTVNLDVVPVEEPHTVQATPVSDYDDYWNAIQHFDFDYINRYDVSEEQRNFVRGLELSINGEYDDAKELFSTLFVNSNDSLRRENIAEVLQELLTYDYEWEKLIELDSQLPNGLDEDNTIAFARAFQSSPPEQYYFPLKPVVLPTKLSISGVPIIEVMVNGVKQKFWIDTGAEMTVLASDIARKCAVTEFKDDVAELGTSTDIMVESWPGVINELRIGELTIENHPTIIIDKKDLEIKLFKLIKIIKIDGILGWNAIMNLHLEIDYKNGLTTIKRPETVFNPERNFHFVCVPFLSLTDTLGTPFNFYFDTGANKTKLFRPGLLKVDTSNATTKSAIIGGAGGTRKVTTTVLPTQSFILGKHRLNFNKIGAHGDGKEYFFYFDGIIGSDIAKTGTLILDFQNGRCELKLAEGD